MVRIDAVDLTEAGLSHDGTRVSLTLVDQAGEKTLLSLPACCLNKVLTTLPDRPEPGAVHRLDSWTMGISDNGQDLILTLRTPEGVAISFVLKPSQMAGMATLATYGRPRQMPVGTVH
jgi:hypothetical protein